MGNHAVLLKNFAVATIKNQLKLLFINCMTEHLLLALNFIYDKKRDYSLIYCRVNKNKNG